MHTNLSLEVARAFEAEIGRRARRQDRVLGLEFKRVRRSRRGRRSR